MTERRRIAYFSMEIGLEPSIPTYAGGLGILAGDTLRSAADLRAPLVAVTLLHRKGYFRQSIDEEGTQQEHPAEWDIEAHVRDAGVRTFVEIAGRRVVLRAWEYDVVGVNGFVVPAYLLDTDLAENDEADRRLTDYLYGGDHSYRLSQEIVLGIGGVRMLEAIGHRDLRRYHLNEGHSSMLGFELLRVESERHGRTDIHDEDVEQVRDRCVFTTHTPVPAGHDQFAMDLAWRLIGDHPAMHRPDVICCDDVLNMTYLALNLSGFVNGVAQRHGRISRDMFAGYDIAAITNGVHARTWTSLPFAQLFDRYIPGWQLDNFSLRYALSIPRDEITVAHERAKRALLTRVHAMTGTAMNEDAFTIGFARRATAYKRSDLLLRDPDRLAAIARSCGGLQFIFAGKAHPGDEQGRAMIRRIVQISRKVQPPLSIVYLADYDMAQAALMTAGVDLWLNTPEPPNEASGTSGMKAAINGVPSLSVLDGWWIEGCIDGVTGWAIDGNGGEPDRSHDHQIIYDRIEREIIPLYRDRRERWIDIMRYAIAVNGSFFNTQRMVQQYVIKAYLAPRSGGNSPHNDGEGRNQSDERPDMIEEFIFPG